MGCPTSVDLVYPESHSGILPLNYGHHAGALTTRRHLHQLFSFQGAEDVGFEPTGPEGPPVFETGTIVHSVSFPFFLSRSRRGSNPQIIMITLLANRTLANFAS